jgi:ABC-2 type transport system ATP-binding protein
MRSEPIIRVQDLTVRYGRLTAVDGLSLEVPKGSVFALLGRNGSGKSSTVRCLLGQQKATSGAAQLFGLDSWRKRRRIMERAAVVPESPDLPPAATAEKLRTFVMRVAPRWRSKEYFSRLDAFGVPRRTPFRKLSKGQQRQLALALALASSPDLLVLDDPTLGLDAVARRSLYEELVGDLADHGTTVFMTTHDLAGVEGIADRVGVLHDGSLLVNENLEALKLRWCRLRWTSDEAVPAATIEHALRHLEPVTFRPGASQVVVKGFTETGFGRFREESRVEVTRVDALSLEEIFVSLCGPNRGGGA